MLMSFMSCSIIVAWHENRDPSSIASGEHSPTIFIYLSLYTYRYIPIGRQATANPPLREPIVKKKMIVYILFSPVDPWWCSMKSLLVSPPVSLFGTI